MSDLKAKKVLLATLLLSGCGGNHVLTDKELQDIDSCVKAEMATHIHLDRVNGLLTIRCIPGGLENDRQ